MIEILSEAPVIFTKDTKWAKEAHRVEPGAIVVLPSDAVLYVPPTLALEVKEPVIPTSKAKK